MNPEQLLRHFDRIAEGPDAVQRLRRFILDLAVRGKLVDQDPNDEPASELLRRIRAEKVQLVKGRKANNQQLPPPFDVGAGPFTLPCNWIWTRLGEIGDWGSGSTPPRGHSEYYGDDVTWLKSGELGDCLALTDSEERVTHLALQKCSFRLNKPGDVLIAMYGATIGKLAILSEEAVTNQAVCGCTPSPGIFSKYLFLFLLSRREDFQGQSEGGAQPNISKVKIVTSAFALPPLAEQHRIVTKVDELMALCDRLEAAQNKREQRRDQLNVASLNRINQPAPSAEGVVAAFREHARFHLDHLRRLTTRPEHIKALRQAILNLAIRGKLAPQDSSDKPASELLKRIAAEKARLVKAGEIRRESSLPSLSESEMAFEIPLGWEWARLGDLSKLVTSGSRDWAKHYSNQGAIFVRMGNLSKDHYRLRLDSIQRVSPPARGEGTRTRLEPGDILISITGDVGMLGLVPDGFGEAYINQHTAMVRPMPEMKGRYLAELFRSPFAQDQFNEPQRGIKNSFRLTDVTQLVVPLPPLAEQHRIVAKVDELMGVCDQLEAQLVTTQTDTHRLLEAVLHEALAPAA